MRTRTMLRWLLLLILLSPAGALAQDDANEGEPESVDEEEGDDPETPPPVEGDEPNGDPASAPAAPELIDEAREIWPGDPERAAPAVPEVPVEVAEPEAPVAPAPEPLAEPAPVPDAAPAAAPEPAAPAVPAARREAKAYLGLGLSIGGARHAMLDEGWQDLTGSEQLESFHWSLDVALMPRLAVSVGGAMTRRHTIRISGGDASMELRPQVSALDVSARFIPTPPSFPVRAFLRAGGGFLRVHAEAADPGVSSNLRQQDHRGAAPYALVGGGLEVMSPHRVKDAVLPLAAGFSFEGGARLGGGGAVVAATSVDLQELGRLDLGPWYVRVSLVGSIVLTPRKYAAMVPSMTGKAR